jgi:hypothetical protein
VVEIERSSVDRHQLGVPEPPRPATLAPVDIYAATQGGASKAVTTKLWEAFGLEGERVHPRGRPIQAAQHRPRRPRCVRHRRCRLRDGEPARWPPLVPLALWEAAQATRARRATKTGRPADPRRPYALDPLHCAACGRRLTGDTGYYRYREPCPPFVAARPEHRGRGQSAGHAYRRELYEQIVEEFLAEASLGAGAIAGVVGEVGRSTPVPDRSVRDRITRDRERAMARYLRDRDASVLERTMAGLDHEESAADHPTPTEAVPADVAVRYVRELPETWRKAEGGTGRQLLASALFSRIEVLGIAEATVHLSAHAVRHGLAAALPAELGSTRKWSGREDLNRSVPHRGSCCPRRSGQRYARWREVTVRGERGRPPGTAARAILGLASPLGAAGEPLLVDPHDVRRRDLLGGLIHEYHGAAA